METEIDLFEKLPWQAVGKLDLLAYQGQISGFKRHDRNTKKGKYRQQRKSFFQLANRWLQYSLQPTLFLAADH